MQHRVRDLLVRQRTQAVNALRSHLAELGIVAAQGYDGVKALLSVVADTSDARLPENARASLSALVAQISCCQAQIAAIDKRLLVQHRKSDNCKRLETLSGIGVLGASAIVATVPDVAVFKTGRHFAAWIGIVSREDSTAQDTWRVLPIERLDRFASRRIHPAKNATLLSRSPAFLHR